MEFVEHHFGFGTEEYSVVVLHLLEIPAHFRERQMCNEVDHFAVDLKLLGFIGDGRAGCPNDIRAQLTMVKREQHRSSWWCW